MILIKETPCTRSLLASMIFLILVFGLIIRLVSLDQSLWLDEATSVLVARDFSFNEILTKFSPGDFHPPLYYLLLKVWIAVFGSSEIAVRMLSVVFGVATVAIVYTIGKKLFSKEIGIVGALFLATAPLHIYYSQEARMYVMETFLATLVAYFVVRRNFLGLTFASAALLYTDYLPVFLLVSFLLYLIVSERKDLNRIVGWISGTAVIFLPWVPTFFSQLQSGLNVRQNAPIWWSTLGKTNLKELSLIPIKFIIGRISFYDKFLYAVYVILTSIPFAVSSLNSLKGFSRIRLLTFWFLLPIIFSAAFGSIFSGFSYFRLIFVLPAFYLIVSFGAFSFKKKELRLVTIGAVVLVNLLSTGIYLLTPSFHRENWRDAVTHIENNSGKDEATIFVSKNQRDPYLYYSNGNVPAFGPDEIEVGYMKTAYRKIWLMRYVQPIFDPNDSVRVKIENMGYTKTSERDFNGIVVWRYE